MIDRTDFATGVAPVDRRSVESHRVDADVYATPAAVDPRLLTGAIAYYQTASAAFKTGAPRATYYRKP